MLLRLCAVMLVLGLAACAASSSAAGPRAGTDRARLLDFLTSHGIAHEETPAGDGTLLIVPAWGARVVGAFFDGDNVFWNPADLSDPKDWNKGGARTWLAPEGHDKGFFFDKSWAGDKWACPASIDPGDYKPVAASRSGEHAYATGMKVTSNDGTAYDLLVTRRIAACDNPLASDPDARSLKFVGIRFAHSLKNLGDHTIDREIDLWSLIMVKPGATMIEPIKADADGYLYRDNYFERVPPGLITDNGNALTMQVAGPPRYKIGIPAGRCLGLTGSLGRLADGSWQVLVKRFPWDPKGTYADRPKDDPKSNGDAIQTYNHAKGGADAFYEVECHSPAWSIPKGEEKEHAIEILIYRGPEKPVKAAASRLFGVDVSKLKLYP